MPQSVLVLLATVFLFGCSVEMIRKEHAPRKGGVIRYNDNWIMGAKNRTKAMDEMNNFCSPGVAQLLSEDSKKEFTGQTQSNSRINGSSVDTTTTQQQDGYIYLQFRCVKAR